MANKTTAPETKSILTEENDIIVVKESFTNNTDKQENSKSTPKKNLGLFLFF